MEKLVKCWKTTNWSSWCQQKCGTGEEMLGGNVLLDGSQCLLHSFHHLMSICFDTEGSLGNGAGSGLLTLIFGHIGGDQVI